MARKISIPPPGQPLPRPATIGEPDAAPAAIAGELRRRQPAELGPNEQPTDRKHLGVLAWSQRLLTAKGNPLEFEQRYGFQKEIYQVFADASVKDAVLMKSVQVGASELLTRLTLYLADSNRISTLYVFPALKQMHDFVDARISPLIEQNPRWAKQGGVMNKGLKRIGDSYCYFRGSEARNDLISVDADLLVLDEYDALDPAHIPEAEGRLAGSKFALIRRVGVPTDPEYGIAKLYEQSDQRRWHVSCARCAELQPLAFQDNLRWDYDDDGEVVDAHIVCRRCQAPLNVVNGSWIAQYPHRSRPGFHVHRLLDPHADLPPLIRASTQRGPHLTKSFYNNGLGLPYSEDSDGLDRTAIAAAISAAASDNGGEPLTMQPNYNGANIVTAGIDVASSRALSVRISELPHLLTTGHPRRRALFIGTADNFQEVAQLLDRYNVTFVCIDAAPEGRLALDLANSFPGRVYLARYANHPEPFRIDLENQSISANRTMILDETTTQIRAQLNLLPADHPDDYVEQMIAPRRVLTTNQYDQRIARYISHRADDYFHAEAYDLLATKIAEVRLVIEQVEQTRGQFELVPIQDVIQFEPSTLNEVDWDPDGLSYTLGDDWETNDPDDWDYMGYEESF